MDQICEALPALSAAQAVYGCTETKEEPMQGLSFNHTQPAVQAMHNGQSGGIFINQDEIHHLIKSIRTASTFKHKTGIALDVLERWYAISKNSTDFSSAITHRFEDVMVVITSYFGMSRYILLNKIKTKELVYARHMLYYIAGVYCNMSQKEIANAINGMYDRSTISHGQEQIRSRLKLYDDVRQDHDAILSRLRKLKRD